MSHCEGCTGTVNVQVAIQYDRPVFKQVACPGCGHEDLERQLASSEEMAVKMSICSNVVIADQERQLAEVREQASVFYNTVHAALGTDGAATNAIEHIEWLRGELGEAKHDIEVYRDALGYLMRTDHDGKLTDGSVPVNEIAADAVRRLAEAQAKNEAAADAHRVGYRAGQASMWEDLAEAQAALASEKKESAYWRNTETPILAKDNLALRATLAQAREVLERCLTRLKGEMDVLIPLIEAALDAGRALGPDYQALYSELLFAVEKKYEGETRHATALRYIQERERAGGFGGVAVTEGKEVGG